MHAALRTGSVDSAIIVGGSNAGELADCCTALGLDVVKHVKSGWKINKDSVDKILPDLAKTLSKTPENVPVIIQGLHNSAYLGATEDGGMAPLSQCVPKDKGFHAVGALVVASERSISSMVTQLNRLISACGDRQVFILSVMPRFIIMPCCDHPGHMTNFLDENYLRTILRDLSSLCASVKKMLVGGQLVDIMELICDDQYTLEKAETAARTGWTTDPVHPSRHTELRRNVGGTTVARKRESLAGPLGAKVGRRGDAAVAACREATAHAAEGALGEEVATTLGGAAVLTAMETRTPPTTVDSETDSTAQIRRQRTERRRRLTPRATEPRRT
jgi:hypothetical protein